MQHIMKFCGLTITETAKEILIEDADGNLRKYDKRGHRIYTSPKLFKENFFFMGASERLQVKKAFDMILPMNNMQAEFIDRVNKALQKINYDYYIATIEPSIDVLGRLYYKKGDPVVMQLQLKEWEDKAKDFFEDEDWQSELATIEEGDLFKAYRLAKNYWDFHYLCNDSSRNGNYKNNNKSKGKFHVIEPSGVRKVGGFADGVGNTMEIYKNGQEGYTILGGTYYSNGNESPVASILCECNQRESTFCASRGIVVLKRK